MLSAPVRRIGGFQLRRGANCVLRPRRRRDGLVGVDDGSFGTLSSPATPSAAATEAVYALASVAAASGTLILGSWNHDRGDQLSSKGSDASTSDSSSSKTQPPPSSRLLYVSLSIVSFLPYINFAAFACLAALESFRDRKEDKNPLSDLLFSPSALAAFSIFYSLPFLLVALTTTAAATGDGGSSGSEHSVFAMESLVLGILHFQAIRLAGERREVEEKERGEESEEASAAAEAAATNGAEQEEASSSSALFASLAASELERFDARLGLRTAKASRLRELAQAAGVLGRGGRGRKEESGGGVASAPVARNKASLAAALAAAATLERSAGEAGGSRRSFDLDFETRDWLTSELAKEVGPLVEKKKRRGRGGTGKGKGAAAARALLEALQEEEEG